MRHSPVSRIESTYKSRDVEEVLDRHFYRPAGYGVAVLARALHVTPNGVSIAGIITGVCAGHLTYYSGMRYTTAAIVLLILSQILDSSDGQLARMTNKTSMFGRILDGLGDNLVFLSVYIHLCFRIMYSGAGPLIFLVAAISGAAHSMQSAAADYFRNAYLRFAHGYGCGELDSSASASAIYSSLTWRHDFIRKCMSRLYLNYTNMQETLVPSIRRLRISVESAFDTEIPKWFKDEYAMRNKPLMKYYNIITTNTRMIALFAFLLMGVPAAYFLFELTVLNLVFFYVTFRQEALNRELNLMVREFAKKEASQC
jgi:hypothetical protein